ncbi:MAG: hypothetical protein M1835_000273, partial [Candelina submexicana]
MHADFRIRLWHWVVIAVSLSLAEAFYIPGWTIKSYKDDEAIPLFVNKVYSDRSQMQYAYYDLPFVCPPSGTVHDGHTSSSGHNKHLNLGEVLRGDRIMTSDYELSMGTDVECRLLCSHEVNRRGVKRARNLVHDDYVVEWIVDNLPGATSFVTTDKSRKYYAAGFKMGYMDFSERRPRYFINNHVTLMVRWRKAPGRAGRQGGKVIVGFEVYTKSVALGSRGSTGCPSDLQENNSGMELYMAPNSTSPESIYPESFHSYTPPAEEGDLDDGQTLTIPYTYSVYFREDDTVQWANRWDPYFVNQDDSFNIHWLAILNSVVVAALLTATVAVVLGRTIRGDIKGIPKEDAIEDGKVKRKRKAASLGSPKSAEKSAGGLLDQIDGDKDGDNSSDEESLDDITGWKLLHGDVFRAPSYGAGLLPPLVGSGMQLVFMAVGLLGLSCLGVLNPSFRGGFISVAIGLFVFAGVISGYFSGRLYQDFGGQNWKKNTLMTALLVPGLIFTLVFTLNLFVWAQASSTALPFGTLVALLSLWLLVQLPLVFLGSWYSYMRAGPWEHPTKTSPIPRQIPRLAWYTRGTRSALLIGLIPFAAVFIELLFVFRSVWQDKSGYYYVFGFLGIVSIVLVVTVIEVTIVAIYFQLCAE